MSLERLSLKTIAKPSDRVEASPPGQKWSTDEKESPFERIIDEAPDRERDVGMREGARPAEARATDLLPSGGRAPGGPSTGVLATGTVPMEALVDRLELAARPRGERLTHSLDALSHGLLAHSAPMDLVFENGASEPGETGGSETATPSRQDGLASANEHSAHGLESISAIGEILGAILADPLATGFRQPDAGAPPVEAPASLERPTQSRRADPPLPAINRANADEPNGNWPDMKGPEGNANQHPTSAGTHSATLPRQLPGIEPATLRATTVRTASMLPMRDVAGSLQTLTVTRRETHFAVGSPLAQSARTIEFPLQGEPIAGPSIVAEPSSPESEARTKRGTDAAGLGNSETTARFDVDAIETGGGGDILRPSTMRVFQAIASTLGSLQGSGPEIAVGAAALAKTSDVVAAGPLKVLGLQLEPATLGKVQIELSMRDGLVNVSLRTESGSAALQIEQDKVELGKAIEARGYRVDDIVVVRGELELGRMNSVMGARGPDHANSDAWLNSDRFSAGAEANSQGQPGRQQQKAGFDEALKGEGRQPAETDDRAAREPSLRSGIIL